jgi:hypothetical protein
MVDGDDLARDEPSATTTQESAPSRVSQKPPDYTDDLVPLWAVINHVAGDGRWYRSSRAMPEPVLAMPSNSASGEDLLAVGKQCHKVLRTARSP